MTWADTILTAYDYQQFISAVSADCDIQKFINTITTDLTEGLSTMAARVGGGFINTIPKELGEAASADNCYDKSVHYAKIFSIVFNYYIK